MKIASAATEYNRRRLAAGDLTVEHVTAVVRDWQAANGLETDAKAGPRTVTAIERRIKDAEYGAFQGPLPRRPRNRDELIAILGDPGTGRDTVDPRWKSISITECHDKNGNRLPGVPPKWWVGVHRLIEPYLREGLRRADETSEYRISRIGGFVFRHQRHDTSRPLSYHSWGAAVDIDAANNLARSFGTNHAPEPWSPEWMRIWPHGLPEDFVVAMESAGWIWGGRWKRFCDPMHFQYVG